MTDWPAIITRLGAFILCATILWLSMDRAEQDSYLRWIGVRK